MPAKKAPTEVEVPRIERETAEFFLVGETPIIFNSMSAKAKRELLMPRGRKTAAEKKNELKHEPWEEFRWSMETSPEGPTLLVFPASGLKKALANAAVDIPGSTKAAVGRLTRVHGEKVPIYGIPQIFTTVVRSADMNKTPDIRTRAIVKDWACRLEVSYVKQLVTLQAISNLLAGAGEIIGIGDFRQQKGAGDYGLFRVSSEADADYQRIAKLGREEQMMAYKDPDYYDSETEELLEWYQDELARRQ